MSCKKFIMIYSSKNHRPGQRKTAGLLHAYGIHPRLLVVGIASEEPKMMKPCSYILSLNDVQIIMSVLRSGSGIFNWAALSMHCFVFLKEQKVSYVEESLHLRKSEDYT
jgi:hypothetical protein